MIRTLASLFIIAVVLLSPVMALAQPAPIGTVIDVEGDNALIMRAAEQGKATQAKTDEVIFMDDVIQTGANGRMIVLLIDDTQFTLGENARMKIDEYVYDDEDTTANKARYTMLQGVFLYTSGLIAKKENPDVKIGIPYGSIGIRGTTVWGGTLDDEYSVFVADGEVTVETNRGRIRVAKDEGTTIRNANAIPERAKAWGAPKVTRATNTVSMKNIEKIKERTAHFRQNRANLIAQHRAMVRGNRLNPAPIPRGGSTREIRPQHQKPLLPITPEQKKDLIEKKKEILQEKTELNAPTVPAPTAPVVRAPEIVAPESLPADPAMRQEAIERRSLQKRPAVAPTRRKQRDPFQ